VGYGTKVNHVASAKTLLGLLPNAYGALDVPFPHRIQNISQNGANSSQQAMAILGYCRARLAH
jgi:hypothetical protein